MIHFQDIRKTYAQGAHAVDGVTLSVPRGECCVLLGASGAGKTTLLRMVNGLVEPTSGKLTVNDQPVTKRSLTAVRKRIGMVHQRFNLSPRLSVLDNVLCGALPGMGTMRSMVRWFPKPLKTKACELLAQVGLDESHLYRKASELSGGQQQRVAIARAFMLDPLIILADEPVASLDPTTSRMVLELLRSTSQKHGTTILCSLHQVDLARDFGDRIVAMARGKVILDGTPAQLTADLERSIYEHAAQSANQLPQGDNPGASTPLALASTA